MLTARKVWLEWNNRVLNVKVATVSSVVRVIVEKGRCWIAAGMVDLSHFVFPDG
jgi:hypothetical protein